MSGTAGAAPMRRMVLAATIGNALEFYDFITYAFFAIQIGHAFFPAQSAYGSLMLSLATFGAGFVTRPIGGLVIGAYADRVGRKPAMILSFTMMGAAITALALVPPYAQIGLAAPVLAVLARMVQGFSLGGEVGPTTAYLMEAAPPASRGLAVSWQGASQGIAATIAGLVGAGLSAVLPADALDAFGWRIAFLIGALTLPFGLWLRRTMTETLTGPEEARAGAEVVTRLTLARRSARIMILALIVLASGTIGTYVQDYLTTFAQGVLKLSPGVSFLAVALGNGTAILGTLAGGWLSDRVGRRPVMIWPNLAFTLMILPLFQWMVASRSAAALLIGSGVLGLVGNLPFGAFYAAVAESLPQRIRGGGFAIVYAVAIAAFGGTTQLVITWLIRVTGSPIAPAWYMFVATAIGQAAMWMIAETAPARLAAGPAGEAEASR